MPPFATTGGISVLSRKRNRVCAELKAASCNTAQFITPGITPKFRMTRRPMGHSAPCIRPLQRRAGLRAITRSFFAISSERDDVILYSRCNFFGGARGAIHCFDLSSWNALVTRISLSPRHLDDVWLRGFSAGATHAFELATLFWRCSARGAANRRPLSPENFAHRACGPPSARRFPVRLDFDSRRHERCLPETQRTLRRTCRSC